MRFWHLIEAWKGSKQTRSESGRVSYDCPTCAYTKHVHDTQCVHIWCAFTPKVRLWMCGDQTEPNRTDPNQPHGQSASRLLIGGESGRVARTSFSSTSRAELSEQTWSTKNLADAVSDIITDRNRVTRNVTVNGTPAFRPTLFWAQMLWCTTWNLAKSWSEVLRVGQTFQARSLVTAFLHGFSETKHAKNATQMVAQDELKMIWCGVNSFVY